MCVQPYQNKHVQVFLEPLITKNHKVQAFSSIQMLLSTAELYLQRSLLCHCEHSFNCAGTSLPQHLSPTNDFSVPHLVIVIPNFCIFWFNISRKIFKSSLFVSIWKSLWTLFFIIYEESLSHACKVVIYVTAI